MLLLAAAGCTSVPVVDSSALPAYAYVPLRDAGIVDDRQSFAGIFCGVLRSPLEPGFEEAGCETLLHLDSTVDVEQPPPQLDSRVPLKVVIVAGFLGDCLARYSTPFDRARRELEADGVESEEIVVGGRASSAHNAPIIAERLSSPAFREGPPLVLVGYSKGVADILEALPLVSGGTDHIAAIVSVAGAVNGSPLASEKSGFMRALIDGFPMRDCPSSAEDGDALESLSYEHRQQWLDQHPLPEDVRYFSVAAYGSSADMSRVNRRSYRKLAHIDDRNDGQIIYRDAILPGSTLLAFAHSDHLAVALEFDEEDGSIATYAVNRNAYPRVVLLKSILIAVQRALIGVR